VAPAGPLPCLDLQGIDERCEQWTRSYDATAEGPGPLQFPADLALSPDDATVFVAMEEQVGEDPWTSPSTWVVAAHDAATGAQRWRISVEGLRAQSFPAAVAVAPDGSALYVAGSDREAFGGGESATVVLALDPASGAERWRARFDGPGGTDNPRTLVADAGGVYVAVISANGDNADLDYVLWALHPDGGERFATRWSGIGDGRVDTPLDIAVAPDGSMVYATGWSAGPGEFNVDFGTVAVVATGEDAGQTSWEARYDGEEGRGPDQAYALQVDDDRVYVTGYSNDLDAGPPFAVNYEFATVAYDAGTGALAWENRRVWDEDNWSTPTEMALAGGRVFVAGLTRGGGDSDYATLALDAGTGAELWAKRQELEQHDFEAPLAIAANEERVYVTGISSSSQTSILFGGQGALSDQATVAYEAASGQRAWLARYNDSGYDDDAAVGVALTGDGERVLTLAQLVRNVQADGDFYDVGLAAYPA
jgi:DNA-binding beta-propeller fold protein YncE